MKKLMFGAAVAATSMVFAATPEAQVYDVCLSIKTTAAATAKLNSKTNPFVGEESETVVYRKQASATWKGLIWGCDCEAIDGVWEEVTQYGDYATIKGCILWDTKTKTPVFVGDESDLTDAETAQGKGFGWNFLNAIDKNGKKVEGAWTMTQDGKACDEDCTLFSFAGAGFGNLCLGADCTSYVKSISGNFAGWMKAPNASSADDWSGCTFCGYEPVYGECEFATAWNYCDCADDFLDIEKTAAYGTWSVKYNSSTSKKLSSKATSVDDTGAVTIRMAYNFKSLPKVSAAILAIENTFWGIDPTGCDDLEAALSKAKTALNEAKEYQESVSTEALTNAYWTARAERQDAITNYTAFVAVSNFFGINGITIDSKKGITAGWYGVQTATVPVWDPITGKYLGYKFDYDQTVADTMAQYGDTTGATNVLLAAEAVQKTWSDEVTTNSYFVTISNVTDGAVVVDNKEIYGSERLAAYVSANYEPAFARKITITDEDGIVVYDNEDLTAAFVTKVAAKATADKLALSKANEAVTKAATRNAEATKAFKAVFDAIVEADADMVDAEAAYESRATLQAAAETKVEAAQTVYDAAKKAYDDAGCND